MGHIKPTHILISSSHKNITYDPIPIILILANSVNLIGCIEVCYRVYYKKCKIGKYQPLPLDSKFSLYIAVSSMYIFCNFVKLCLLFFYNIYKNYYFLIDGLLAIMQIIDMVT